MVSSKEIKKQLVEKAHEVEGLYLDRAKTKMETDGSALIEMFEERARSLEKELKTLKDGIRMQREIAEYECFLQEAQEKVNEIKNKEAFLVRHR